MDSALLGSPQYASASSVPLIKSPSLYLPPPVSLPPDIHPLPEDIHAYFVYPFTLEPHILTSSPAFRSATSSRQASHVAYLLSREQEKEDRKRQELRRVAPGWGGGVMEPMRAGTTTSQQQQQSGLTSQGGGQGQQSQPPPTRSSFIETEFAGLDLSSSLASPPGEISTKEEPKI